MIVRAAVLVVALASLLAGCGVLVDSLSNLSDQPAAPADCDAASCDDGNRDAAAFPGADWESVSCKPPGELYFAGDTLDISGGGSAQICTLSSVPGPSASGFQLDFDFIATPGPNATTQPLVVAAVDQTTSSNGGIQEAFFQLLLTGEGTASLVVTYDVAGADMGYTISETKIPWLVFNNFCHVTISVDNTQAPSGQATATCNGSIQSTTSAGVLIPTGISGPMTLVLGYQYVAAGPPPAWSLSYRNVDFSTL
jgi:hypothetical protein